jgi:hypothetical protein
MLKPIAGTPHAFLPHFPLAADTKRHPIRGIYEKKDGCGQSSSRPFFFERYSAVGLQIGVSYVIRTMTY